MEEEVGELREQFAAMTTHLDSFKLMAQQFMAAQGHVMHDPWAAGQDQDNIETSSSEAEVASVINRHQPQVNREDHETNRQWEFGLRVDIPEFQGSLEADDFLDWLGAIEEILEFKDVSADKHVFLVATRFRGRAAA
ncbi:Uncharacterized protein Adt_12368 [Abeliophyllum distichum]|uniref:Uncharacterized protein n=1 Tax=Abeliophyllum distichum TaxID=126358 RepID=A0ABD1UQK6_9LAMI